MKLFRRLRNLWRLSAFEVTVFDKQFLITKKEDEITFSRQEMAQIIKRKDLIDELLQ